MREIQNEISKKLFSASVGYGNAGLALFHGHFRIARNNQSIIGNLAIATELLLKGFIAKRSLLLFLKDAPLELKCALSAPDALPPSFKKAPHKTELRSSTYKSIELDEAITIFGVFSPETKKRLNAHLKFLSRCRNLCVHAVLPDFREYEVQRTVFLYLQLFAHIQEQDSDMLEYHSIGDKKKNEDFLLRFNEERIARVHSAIEAAREKAKKIENPMSIDVSEWDICVIDCPVCGCDGLLYGQTQEDYEAKDEFSGHLYLTFVGDSFECEECGLELKDYDELEIAGIDPVIDRSDKTKQWGMEHYEREPGYCFDES
jgi:hypothetical protein